jgi:hypothetical protein
MGIIVAIIALFVGLPVFALGLASVAIPMTLKHAKPSLLSALGGLALGAASGFLTWRGLAASAPFGAERFWTFAMCALGYGAMIPGVHLALAITWARSPDRPVVLRGLAALAFGVLNGFGLLALRALGGLAAPGGSMIGMVVAGVIPALLPPLGLWLAVLMLNVERS